MFGLLGTAGYLYSPQSLYSASMFSTMALHTAIGFLVIGIGILHAVPGRGFMAISLDPGPGGRLLRWLVPAVVAIPLGLGWLISRAVEAGSYDYVFGLSLSGLASIVLFGCSSSGAPM